MPAKSMNLHEQRGFADLGRQDLALVEQRLGTGAVAR